jgi:hypothetical protein
VALFHGVCLHPLHVHQVWGLRCQQRRETCSRSTFCMAWRRGSGSGWHHRAHMGPHLWQEVQPSMLRFQEFKTHLPSQIFTVAFMAFCIAWPQPLLPRTAASPSVPRQAPCPPVTASIASRWFRCLAPMIPSASWSNTLDS